jgi:hypothetical protein
MRHIAILVVLASIGLTAPRLGLADSCHTPAAPDNFPEGTSATEASIVAAQQSVKQYLSEMEGSLKCFDTMHQEHLRDAAVDDMKKVAAKFNAVLRAYRAKQAG